jgi:uncharacterized membrane protein
MIRLTTGTFRRPDDMTNHADPAVLYIQSYLLTRTLVGIIGIVFPFVLIIGEAFFLKGGVHVRGSLSAYYHTSMRDIFVGCLCVTGFLLATYMSGNTRSWDFWVSLVGGVAVLGVVFFPTSRPGLPADAPRCGTLPPPAGCSPIQQQLGESPVAWVHYVCAGVFILSLAAMAFLFAHRAQKYDNDIAMARFQYVCGGAILAALAWVAIGGLLDVTLWEITPLYLGEVVSVWAFGASWLLKGKDLRAVLGLAKRRQPSARDTQGLPASR